MTGLAAVPEGAVALADIMACRTPKGAWTRAQLAAWGVPWPPPAGWKQRLAAGAPAKPKEPRARITPALEARLREIIREEIATTLRKIEAAT